MPTFKTVRGMRDLLLEESQKLNGLVEKARKIGELYGYMEVVTPIVEPYELLSVKSGDEIRSRMFVFEDLGHRKVALRPEFTSSIARLVSTDLKNEPKPLRILSVGSVYRYDEPQRGRYREFWQSNFELMGSNRPESDAEMILLTDKFLKELGLRDYVFKIGHVGILREVLTSEKVKEKTQDAVLLRMDKKEYAEALELIESKNCREVIQGLIGLSIDSVPQILNEIKEQVKIYEKALRATENMEEVWRLVTESGCKEVIVDAGFARGLEYYTGIIFEVYIPELDIALGGGGRYDKLIEVFGGKPTPAVGVAHGLDRIGLALQMQNITIKSKRKIRVVIIPVMEELKGEALKISQSLRGEGIPTEFEVMGRKVGRALEDADRRKADYAIIVGERELKEKSVVFRDLAKREQTVIKIRDLPKKISGSEKIES
ncbi:histidine--tRNA ligase [Candidatus Bathyarchaeota archaeon]|nr:histidine--tRNA ligase [Candidatus Bathyarchaeota archaeon]